MNCKIFHVLDQQFIFLVINRQLNHLSGSESLISLIYTIEANIKNVISINTNKIKVVL